jgi:hypothetical protein
MPQVERPKWKRIDGELVEHVYDTPTGMEHYSIYLLNSLKGEVLYGYARNWTLQAFRLEPEGLPDGVPPEMLYFTSLAEARAAAGNVLNEERGIEPFRYDKTRYTDEPMLHYCLCCGYRTIEGYETNFGYARPPDTFDICPICFWQDDAVGYDKPDIAIGPNHVSLKQAQRNFLAFGASEERVLPYVRKPTPEDERDPNWRLLD